jgi:tetratricopeptide (TPR) repeat protein
VDCVKYLSLYQQDFKNKDYASAIVFWRHVFKNCPNSSVNNVPRGIAMYQYFISRELNPNAKSALVDTLMLVYEAGIASRPQKKGEYLASMAQDMQKYLENTPATQKKILKVLEASMVTDKENTLPVTYATYMKLSIDLNGAGNLSDEELLDNYTKVSDLLSAAIRKTSNEELAKARDMIDYGFASSPAANCENLGKIYTPKFDRNKNDLEFLTKLTRLLNRNECTDSKLFEQASEKQFELDPSAASAFNMAKLFLKKENFAKALEYFDNAVEHETDPIDKAKYLCQKGGLLLSKFSKYADAKKCALDAAKLRPDWGEPYVLLSNVYAQGPKCGEDDFEKAQVYWVIVDKLIKAKTVDPDYAERVNGTIRSYAQYFPRKEEAFFRNITEGSSVSVECWVNETTKARW